MDNPIPIPSSVWRNGETLTISSAIVWKVGSSSVQGCCSFMSDIKLMGTDTTL